MRRREALALALALAATPALAQLPPSVTLDEVLRLAERSPRVTAAEREADAARADRDAAGALPNPSLTFGHSRPSGPHTMFDGSSQEQATVELPVPVFGQRGARMRAADLQVGRADSQRRLTGVESKRQAALAYLRLLAAQEQLAARNAAAAEVERIRGVVVGRLESGMASRYDQARADAELSLARLAAQRAESDVSEQQAALAAALGALAWQPRAAGSLAEVQRSLERGEAQALADASPAARLARDESAAAQGRVDLAERERFPVPSIAVGRSWTNSPFGAANYIGLTSEVPIFDTRRAQADRARAEAASARERERAVNATLQADYQRHRDTLRQRRAALARLDQDVPALQGSFLEMAESAYRLGKGSLFELLDARRTQAEAAVARLELVGAIIESELELRALAGEL